MNDLRIAPIDTDISGTFSIGDNIISLTDGQTTWTIDSPEFNLTSSTDEPSYPLHIATITVNCAVGYKLGNVTSDKSTLSFPIYGNKFDINYYGLQGSSLVSATITVTAVVDESLQTKPISYGNLQEFKTKCDETYAPMSRALPAPMSRALPAPAGTTDAGKVPTVNSAGNGYTLQTPSGGGKQLYQHNLRVHNDDYSIVLTFTIINDTNVEMSYSDIVQFLETITGTYGNYTYPCSGICQGMPTGTAPVTGIDCGLSTGNIIYHFVKDNSQFADSLLSNHANIIDIIIPL